MATSVMLEKQCLQSERGCVVPDEEKNIWHIFSQGEIQVYLLRSGHWKIERNGLAVVMMPDKLFELALARDESANLKWGTYGFQKNRRVFCFCSSGLCPASAPFAGSGA